MSDESDLTTLSVQIANQFVNVANGRLHDGVAPGLLAAAMRHAAANFSAFAAQFGEGPADETPPEEFARMYAYYLQIHRHEEEGSNLERLIAKAKAESDIQ